MTNVADKPVTEITEPSSETPTSKLGKIGHQCNIGLQKCLVILGKVPLKILLLITIVGLAVKINNDTTSVFSPFNVPPELEEKGYTGAEIVHHLNDQMEAIRSQVRHHEEALYMQIPGMQDALEMEMPGTGVSLNQITDLVSHFIGATPQRISGSIALEGESLLLTIRISDYPSKIIRGTINDHWDLVRQAAEHILKHLEPFLLGRYYVMQQRFQDANDLVTHLRSGSGRPTQEQAITADLIEGSIWYEQKNYIKALRAWNKAYQRDPNNTNVLLFQGHALDEMKRHQEAIHKYQRVVEIEPGNTGALNDWGVALYHLERYREAIALFIRVTHLDPQYPQAYNNWGFTLFAAGEYAKGMLKVREAIRLDPQAPEYYVTLAEGMMYLDEHERAIQSLYAVLSVFPQQAEACQVLVQALHEFQQLITIPVVCSEVFN